MSNGPCAVLCGRLSGLVSILHPSAELRGVPDLMAPERHPLPVLLLPPTGLSPCWSPGHAGQKPALDSCLA